MDKQEFHVGSVGHNINIIWFFLICIDEIYKVLERYLYLFIFIYVLFILKYFVTTIKYLTCNFLLFFQQVIFTVSWLFSQFLHFLNEIFIWIFESLSGIFFTKILFSEFLGAWCTWKISAEIVEILLNCTYIGIRCK